MRLQTTREGKAAQERIRKDRLQARRDEVAEARAWEAAPAWPTRHWTFDTCVRMTRRALETLTDGPVHTFDGCMGRFDTDQARLWVSRTLEELLAVHRRMGLDAQMGGVRASDASLMISCMNVLWCTVGRPHLLALRGFSSESSPDAGSGSSEAGATGASRSAASEDAPTSGTSSGSAGRPSSAGSTRRAPRAPSGRASAAATSPSARAATTRGPRSR